MKEYCICRTKDGKGFMIQCDNCDEWFHGRCVGLTKKSSASIEQYYCENCISKDSTLSIKYRDDYIPPPEKKPASSKQEPLEERKQEKKITDKNQSTSAPSKAKSKYANYSQPKTSQTKRRTSQKTKSKGHSRKQCGNPECVNETRQESKYCSDECGYAFNKKRYDTFFIPKWKILEANHSQARLKKMKDLDQLERDKVDVEQLIKNLKAEKEELEQNIKIIKERAKKMSKESADSKENSNDKAKTTNDDGGEETTSSDAKIYCVTCGKTYNTAGAFSHWSSCHKKHEASYNFTADVPVNYTCKEDENPRLYCLHQDKKTKRYCMNIESACPQHCNWHNDKDEVCGCPTNIMQKLVPDGKYCLELKVDCTQHYHWDRFRLAQMNMQRVHAFSRLEYINDRIRSVTANLADTYGGVVGVMLHNTLNHLSEKDGSSNVSPYQQEELDIDMVVD